ncbi:hypothetical protein [Cellulomonas telluris]|uniref:hypothetical protein n=1 Tax=Cellulomonas telluris TaxID=2306636 RepID=UPI0010A89F83|nr:hypothetical protein [Cellulomonas telluris]
MSVRGRLLAVAALGAGAATAVVLRRGRTALDAPGRGTLAVTVALTADEVDARATGLDDELGALLARARRTPAPGGRGTELRVDDDGHDRAGTRQTLRLLKQQLETGSTMPPDDLSGRPPTPQGLALDAVLRAAGREGRL